MEDTNGDYYLNGYVDFEKMAELELENIKFLEVARAAKRIHEGSPYSGDWIAIYADFVKALKSLEESGVKI